METKEIKTMRVILHDDCIQVKDIHFSFIERIKIFLTILFRPYLNFHTAKGVRVNIADNIGNQQLNKNLKDKE